MSLRRVCAWGVLLVSVAVARGDAVRGARLPLVQPDGYPLEVYVWGDEFYSVVETLDGYTLVRDTTNGVICYAALSPDGTLLVSTGVRAEQPPPPNLPRHLRIDPAAAAAQARMARADFERRAYEGPFAPPAGLRAARTTTGAVLGLTLLIDFADDPATIPAADVDAYCNQAGYTGYGNNGSVRDYFHSVSDELLTYTNYIPAQYYRALHPKTYYNDPNVPYGTRARELIVEALAALEAGGLDFSQFDANDDHVIDALNCFYAGYSNSAWAQGLWPHAWTVYFCADGVCTHRYQMTDMQNQLRLGTFCHENGHMLMGWPDLYDYDYDSTGVGQFCLMCYGTSSTNPCEPCAYMKIRAGWGTVIELETPQNGLTLPASSQNYFYRFSHPSAPNEYYLIENRQKTGRDVGLPDAGLALWHIDEYGSNNNQQQLPDLHYLVTLVQADGAWDLEHNHNYGDSTDLWAAPAFVECSPLTNPDTNWWDAQASDLYILNISTSAAVMTFDFFTVGADCNGNGVPDHTDLDLGLSLDCNANAHPDECDIAESVSSDCDANGAPDDCDPDCDGDGVSDACEWTGAGLAGAYFATPDLTGPALGRIDSSVEFYWGPSSPWPDFPNNHFSVRWQGYVHTLDAAGLYRFFTYTDDGVRLWVDGELLIDHWNTQGPTEWSGQIQLAAQRRYPIRAEYFDDTLNAVAVLRWQPPGGVKSTLPSSQLSPGSDCNGNGTLDRCDLASGTSLDLDGDTVPDECAALVGDANCDGSVGFRDINPFVLALSNPAAYAAAYPDCSPANLDINGDGALGFTDINPFVTLLASR